MVCVLTDHFVFIRYIKDFSTTGMKDESISSFLKCNEMDKSFLWIPVVCGDTDHGDGLGHRPVLSKKAIFS